MVNSQMKSIFLLSPILSDNRKIIAASVVISGLHGDTYIVGRTMATSYSVQVDPTRKKI